MEKTVEELNKIFTELLKNETKFCEENEFAKNEYGAYIFVSANGNQSIRLDCILRDYKEYLIDNEIVKEKY